MGSRLHARIAAHGSGFGSFAGAAASTTSRTCGLFSSDPARQATLDPPNEACSGTRSCARQAPQRYAMVLTWSDAHVCNARCRRQRSTSVPRSYSRSQVSAARAACLPRPPSVPVLSAPRGPHAPARARQPMPPRRLTPSRSLSSVRRCVLLQHRMTTALEAWAGHATRAQ